MGLSTIQWCDFTENFWLGCRFAVRADGTSIEECWHCYAKTLDDNRYSKTLDGGTKEKPVSHWGSGPRHRTSEANWNNPRVWNRKAICTACGFAEWLGSDDCRKCGRNFSAENRRRPRVFSLSLGDWLDDEVPIQWFADMLKVIHDTPNLDWLTLTKRPQNWGARAVAAMEYFGQDAFYSNDAVCGEVSVWLSDWLDDSAPSNVWIGVSAGTDQAAALAIPARIHFLSCEPMLRPMDTSHAVGFNWIIFGGESGSKARRCDVDWIEDGIDFCRAHGIAPFVKQLGSQPHIADASHPHGWEGNNVDWEVTGRIYLKDSHGGDMAEWPEDLRVREFPV